MNALTFVPERTTPSPAEVLAATDAFWAAHNAAETVRANLTREQRNGPAALPADLERLDGEAQGLFDDLLMLVGLDGMFGSLASLFRDDLSDYAERSRVANPAAPFASFSYEATGPTDWSRGR